MRQERTKQKEKARQQSNEAKSDESNEKGTSPSVAFTDPKNKIWVILSASMAITVLAAQIFQGVAVLNSMASIYSAMLWTGIFGAALARYMLKSGWFGFALGSAAGAALTILIGIFA
ncbi:hypothetical protein DRW07_12265 [Alteromonas sediminis]|uniref:Uncharacterized protein n=1 Tax=Alteromonas sediminis TaxID=2259342 RepID=A0A3N5Z5K9_9ALTE|nr:hypothetical protein [Alteromonas sediminis]RPJ65594.1 hypothetical protein DRW07_12265 [Alteromonas sediminis]